MNGQDVCRKLAGQLHSPSSTRSCTGWCALAALVPLTQGIMAAIKGLTDMNAP